MSQQMQADADRKGHVELNHPDPYIINSETELDPANIRNRVLEGEVVILKDLFNKNQLESTRQSVIKWRSQTAKEDIAFCDADKTFHKLLENDPDFIHPRMYHVHWFYDLLSPEPPADEVHDAVSPLYQELKNLYNRICGTDHEIEWRGDRPHFHPQINQYPRGGGYFGMHRHYPSVEGTVSDAMKINMIVGLSEQGKDYGTGGTRILNGENMYDIRNSHDLGDVALFRADLPHAVMPIDPSVELDWDADDGRWTMLMPFHW